MATKNGVCPYCQINRLQNRIFPVNPEASTVFCPSCMREIEPKKAIELYSSIIEKMVNKADSTLFVACDPVKAYQEYAEVLEVEPLNSRALLGRILCLIYTSKVRQSYLVEANELLGSITHKGAEEVAMYVNFLKRINFALDEYDLALLNRLTIRKYFYNEECLKHYLKRLSDIIKFKKEILDKLLQIKKDYVTQNNEVLINLISHNISEKESFLKSPKHLVSGEGYKYSKIVGDKIYVDRLDEVVNTKIYKHRDYTLTDNGRGRNAIKDKVFKDYTPIIKAKKISIYLSIFLLLVSIAAGGCAYYFFANKILFPVFVSVSIVSFIAFLTLFILHLVWKSTLKKRKLRIA